MHKFLRVIFLAKSTFCFTVVTGVIFVFSDYDAKIELGSHYASRTIYECILLYNELHRDPGWRVVDSKI